MAILGNLRSGQRLSVVPQIVVVNPLIRNYGPFLNEIQSRDLTVMQAVAER
jgi:hypothetical protein